jgi:hypothetical protein
MLASARAAFSDGRFLIGMISCWPRLASAPIVKVAHKFVIKRQLASTWFRLEMKKKLKEIVWWLIQRFLNR